MIRERNTNGIEYFKWSEQRWIKRPIWGIMHPEEPYTWFDPDCISIDDSNCANIQFKRNPVEIKVEDKTYNPVLGNGWMESTVEFKYGVFSWDAILPVGRNLWPALWLASDYSWPPEIDCMEGWSNNNPKYIKRFLFRNIKPTTHWTNTMGEHLQETKNNICRFILHPGKKVDNFKVVWTRDYVDVLYNNIRVKRFNDKELLAQLNQKDVFMHPIMSYNVQTNSKLLLDAQNGKDFVLDEKSVFKVFSFNYYPC